VKAAGFAAHIAFRIRGGIEATLVFNNGVLQIEAGSGEPVDCRLSDLIRRVREVLAVSNGHTSADLLRGHLGGQRRGGEGKNADGLSESPFALVSAQFPPVPEHGRRTCGS